MEPGIRELYTDNILADLCSRFGTRPADLVPLEGFESFVYAYRCAAGERVLRVSHSLHRPQEQIGAELQWLMFLSEQGLPVCRPVLSANGNLLETLATRGGHFTAAAFEHAGGEQVTPGRWAPPLFRKMGRVMAQLHEATIAYQPPVANWYRPNWEQDCIGLDRYLPASEQTIINGFAAVLAETRKLPRSDDTFGLVHLDFHRGNFHVDRGEIYLFDFDDCQYSWFADDIAMALFYAIPHDCSSAEDRAFAASFLSHFLLGYREIRTIDESELANIPLFMKRREHILYCILFGASDTDTWATSFLKDRKRKLEQHVPYVLL